MAVNQIVKDNERKDAQDGLGTWCASMEGTM